MLYAPTLQGKISAASLNSRGLMNILAEKKGGKPCRREQIVETLADRATPNSLERLEEHFKDSLLVVAGTTQAVATHAEELRLAITTHECGQVLDHLAPQIRITIEQTDEAINTLFPGRFIEP
jgi:hypothetical protein